MTYWNALHFVRPDALWALLGLPLIVLLWSWRRRRSSVWLRSVDPHLLPHLLMPVGSGRAWTGLALLLCGWSVAVLALAGPSWRQLAQPLWQAPAPLVVALDLSSRTRTTDLPPSRLLQARAKLASLLRERHGGEVALLVYADDAFTVAPLTADMGNVALYLDALDPEVMPRDGQRADRAIDAAVLLLQQSGVARGDILVLTDQADAAANVAAANARTQGMQVSVLGLGTPAGAAYRADDGQIARARLDEASLRALANAGGGRYAGVANDDTDLRALRVLDPRAGAGERQEGDGLAWQDEGFWLLPMVMLLSLFAFRRRGVVAVALAALLLPVSLPQPVHAQEAAPAESTLWQRADQRGQQRLDSGVEAYRRGDFPAAQRQFERVDGAEARYNLGNALARQGQYDAAIQAYDEALALRPGMPDAVANRAAVDAARRRQPPPTPPSPGQGQGAPQKTPQAGQPGQSGTPDAQGSPSQRPPPAATAPPTSGRQGTAQDPGKPDAAEQARADAAQRERMRQALQRQAGTPGAGQVPDDTPAETPQQREQRQAVEAWMRRVPDDPGSLLRAKFQLENERRKREGR